MNFCFVVSHQPVCPKQKARHYDADEVKVVLSSINCNYGLLLVSHDTRVSLWQLKACRNISFGRFSFWNLEKQNWNCYLYRDTWLRKWQREKESWMRKNVWKKGQWKKKRKNLRYVALFNIFIYYMTEKLLYCN